MMGCWCDEHDCRDCPGNKPSGPCWEPAESEVLEIEYWNIRCAAEDRDLEDEERQLLDAIDADLAICAEIAAEEAYEADKFNP